MAKQLDDEISRRIRGKTDRLSILSGDFYKKEIEDLRAYFSLRSESAVIDELIRINSENENESREFYEFFQRDYKTLKVGRVGESVNFVNLYLERGMKKTLKSNYSTLIENMSEVIRALVSFYWKKLVEPSDKKVLELMKKAEKAGLKPVKVNILKDFYSILIKKEE